MLTHTPSFKSDRKFCLYGYQASHGPMLLRSGKTDLLRTRIDVLIMDVRAMEIRSWFDGIEIAEVDRDYLRGFKSHPDEMMEQQPGLRVYALTGDAWKGFIVGGNMYVREDDRGFGDPSSLLPERKIYPPSTPEVEAAARELIRAGIRHHWWGPYAKSYDEMAEADAIAKDELDGIVEQILMASYRARLE